MPVATGTILGVADPVRAGHADGRHARWWWWRRSVALDSRRARGRPRRSARTHVDQRLERRGGCCCCACATVSPPRDCGRRLPTYPGRRRHHAATRSVKCMLIDRWCFLLGSLTENAHLRSSRPPCPPVPLPPRRRPGSSPREACRVAPAARCTIVVGVVSGLGDRAAGRGRRSCASPRPNLRALARWRTISPRCARAALARSDRPDWR